MSTFTIHAGDALEVLPTLESESVHMVATSPPYWGLRDYGIPPSIWGGDPNCAHEWGGMARWQYERFLERSSPVEVGAACQS